MGKAIRWTPAQLEAFQVRTGRMPVLPPAATAPAPAEAKYRNTKTEVDGQVFDSLAEAKRYGELKAMEKAGLIAQLEMQVEYEIVPPVVLDGKQMKARKYRADFRYTAGGKVVVEDVKGFRTPEYRLKRHLMMAVHGIEVQEVGKTRKAKRPGPRGAAKDQKTNDMEQLCTAPSRKAKKPRKRSTGAS